ncbi:MAG: amidohydrolase family protein [Pirellulaceae bacterium]|nr:amidohydrolase family protein [Planctomycetales bacterium]
MIPRRRVATCLCVLLSIQSVPAVAGPEIPGPPQDHPIALVGGTLHTMEDPPEVGSTILLERGVITAVGKDIRLPAKTERIDVRGKHVYPSLIASNTALGLVEIDAVRATRDLNETGSVNPNVRAYIAFNPDSEAIPVARANGILLANVVPSGGRLSGQSSLMMLDGWNATDMVLRPTVGLHVQWPRIDSTNNDREPTAELAELLRQARGHARARQAASGDVHDLRLESMLDVIEQRLPLFVHADELSQIQSAVAFCQREGLKMVLVGGYDAPRCSGLLKQFGVPVVVTGTQRLPRARHDAYDEPYTVPARLEAAGVMFALASEERFSAAAVRNLPYHAGMAVAYGLDQEIALRAITIRAAEILGVADRVGSLSVGKDATLFVADGDILETSSQVERAYVQGRDVDLDNRHKRLWRKYQRKYQLSSP